MPYYTTVTYSSAGTYPSINMDPGVAPFNASVAVTILSTATTYKMQFSLDPMSVADSAATWFDSDNMPTGTSSSVITNIAFPVSRVRLVVTTISSNVVFQVRQGLG